MMGRYTQWFNVGIGVGAQPVSGPGTHVGVIVGVEV
jgi:hypothetical protein